MKLSAIMPVGLLLSTSCSSEIDSEQRQYDIVKNTGSAADICRHGDRLVEAYLRAGKEADYSREKVFASIECQTAESEERDGIFRMPDGTKRKVTADDVENIADDEANAI